MLRAAAPPRFVIGLVLGAAFLAAGERLGAQSDLDALMAKVLARRDDNWKKLQQFVLEERETFQLTAPGDRPMFGFRREYQWFPRDGRFVKEWGRLGSAPGVGRR